MSRVDGIVCITNEGIYESGQFDKDHWYTIDKITLKMSDGRRLRRYAVCENGCWKSSQYISLREAREYVDNLRREYRKPKFKPLTIAEMRQIEKEEGSEQAYNLLLLGGYGFIDATVKEYDELLEEFRRGFQHE